MTYPYYALWHDGCLVKVRAYNAYYCDYSVTVLCPHASELFGNHAFALAYNLTPL